MLLRYNFCVELRFVRVDLKNLKFFNGMLLHSYVAMVKHFDQLSHILQTVRTRSSNMIVFDMQLATSY